MQFKIDIPQPCREKWNAMSPNENGRFCHSCSKTVVDFRKMSDIEVQKYFHASTQEVCGYFRPEHIESKKNSIRYDLEARFSKIKFSPIRKIAVLSLGLLFITSSCFMGKRATKGEVETSETESVKENELIVHDQNVEKVEDSTGKIKN
jgi:hypothetical protein